MKRQNTVPEIDSRSAQRETELHAAFVTNYGTIRDAAFEEWNQLTIFEAERITNSLAANLFRYRRPPGEGFIRWACARVKREVRRHQFLTETLPKYSRVIYAAFTRGMFAAGAADFAHEPCDAESELCLHLLQNPRKIDQLLRPSKAKLSTQIYALTKSRTRGYRSQLADRRKLLAGVLPDGETPILNEKTKIRDRKMIWRFFDDNAVTSAEEIAQTKTFVPAIEHETA